jgi:hypothetical protein
MANYVFARMVTRAYFEIEADSEAAARAILEAAEDEDDFCTGERFVDPDEDDYALVDIKTEEQNP